MNKENAHLFLPLVQALAEGKTIQNISTNRAEWVDMDNLKFDGNPEDYRVKPEPREWRIRCMLDGSAQFDIGGLAAPRGETIRVREILD